MTIIKIETTHEMVEKVYKKSKENIKKFRTVLNRPLTLTEKILAGHLEEEFLNKNLDETTNYVFFHLYVVFKWNGKT